MEKESLKNKVLEYLQSHPNQKSTEDGIAEALGVNMLRVMEALFLLQDEGKVKSFEESTP